MFVTTCRLISGHSQVVDPATVPLVSGHYCRNHTAANYADQEKLRINFEFPKNILLRFVGGPDQVAFVPESDDLIGVGWFKRPDLHWTRLRENAKIHLKFEASRPINHFVLERVDEIFY